MIAKLERQNIHRTARYQPVNKQIYSITCWTLRKAGLQIYRSFHHFAEERPITDIIKQNTMDTTDWWELKRLLKGSFNKYPLQEPFPYTRGTSFSLMGDTRLSRVLLQSNTATTLNIIRCGISAVHFKDSYSLTFFFSSSVCKKEYLTFPHQLFGAVLYGLWLCLPSLSATSNHWWEHFLMHLLLILRHFKTPRTQNIRAWVKFYKSELVFHQKVSHRTSSADGGKVIHY